MAHPNHIPAYRFHKSSGQAIVTLTDAISGGRKDHLLGPHGGSTSRAEYARLIGEWEARGRRLDFPRQTDLTVAELLVRYLQHAETYYGKESKEYGRFERTGIPLADTYPHKPVNEFGPAELKVVRQRMVDHHHWSRGVVNSGVNRIRRIWKWGVEEGVVRADIWHALQVVPGLRAGRTTARETEDRKPVSEELVAATVPHLPRHVRGLVGFQLLTGCRPQEACQPRMCDVDRSGQVWVYSPNEHKNARRGHARHIGIGPETQKLLTEYTAGITPEDVVFSPRRQRGGDLCNEAVRTEDEGPAVASQPQDEKPEEGAGRAIHSRELCSGYRSHL